MFNVLLSALKLEPWRRNIAEKDIDIGLVVILKILSRQELLSVRHQKRPEVSQQCILYL